MRRFGLALLLLLAMILTGLPIQAVEEFPVGGFFAYAPSFTGGVHVAVCGVDQYGQLWTATAPGAGQLAIINFYRFGGTPPPGAIFLDDFGPVYSFGWLGGAHVSCQVLGTTLWLMVGAGPGGGPHVRVFAFPL